VIRAVIVMAGSFCDVGQLLGWWAVNVMTGNYFDVG